MWAVAHRRMCKGCPKCNWELHHAQTQAQLAATTQPKQDFFIVRAQRVHKDGNGDDRRTIVCLKRKPRQPRPLGCETQLPTFSTPTRENQNRTKDFQANLPRLNTALNGERSGEQPSSIPFVESDSSMTTFAEIRKKRLLLESRPAKKTKVRALPALAREVMTPFTRHWLEHSDAWEFPETPEPRRVQSQLLF